MALVQNFPSSCPPMLPTLQEALQRTCSKAAAVSIWPHDLTLELEIGQVEKALESTWHGSTSGFWPGHHPSKPEGPCSSWFEVPWGACRFWVPTSVLLRITEAGPQKSMSRSLLL